MDWPNVTPIKSTRIYQEIARQVKSMIAEGRLKGGDRLPPERDLADKFVVSRPTEGSTQRQPHPQVKNNPSRPHTGGCCDCLV
jgi:DNA-binding transcriptional MocR family regulator